jgi:cellulose 1,4-beta-cellobiosidase
MGLPRTRPPLASSALPAVVSRSSPGSYYSIYQGCHWGECSAGGSSVYDVAYDIWFNRTATTAGQPNCTEIMVWLNYNGPVQPFGSTVASGVNVGGTGHTAWEGGQSSWDTVGYVMNSPTSSVGNLDIALSARDAVSRGYLSNSCCLIDVEAGFELWQGGAVPAGGSTTFGFAATDSGSDASPATVVCTGSRAGAA